MPKTLKIMLGKQVIFQTEVTPRLSGSGKSVTVASTDGNKPVAGEIELDGHTFSDARIGVNVYDKGAVKSFRETAKKAEAEAAKRSGSQVHQEAAGAEDDDAALVKALKKKGWSNRKIAEFLDS